MKGNQSETHATANDSTVTRTCKRMQHLRKACTCNTYGRLRRTGGVKINAIYAQVVRLHALAEGQRSLLRRECPTDACCASLRVLGAEDVL